MSKLAPVAREITAGGETFTILPFGFGLQVKTAARIAGVMSSLGMSEGDTLDLPTLLTHGTDVVLDIVADAVGRPRAWLDALPDFEEGLALAEAVWSVNAEVLTKKVLPAVAKKLAQLSAAKTTSPAA